MKLFLRALSICYFFGFVFHLMDILNIRLQFSTMETSWKIWIAHLFIADLIAAIGLWKTKKWGEYLFILIASSQLIAYSGLIDTPKNQLFLVSFHLFTLVTYLILRFHARRRRCFVDQIEET